MKYDPRIAALFRHGGTENLKINLREKEITLLTSQSPVQQWTADALSHLMSTRLADEQIIVVSNRQPFTHDVVDGKVTLVQPASGLVTALEPIVRACDGTWIAHGSGQCDRDFVDAFDRCPAPAGNGSYKLRRLWLSRQEQQSYCDGFANSGLWPLCHLVHVKPVFNETDWQAYRAVNAKFADAVVREARGPDPIVLIQDYHLALVPQLLGAQLPHATIVCFWHIPWTHPEQMAVCPWITSLVAGLLGSDIVGFQTAQHSRNFSALADGGGEMGSRAMSALQTQPDEATQVRAYPISIAWPSAVKSIKSQSPQQCRTKSSIKWSLGDHGKLIIGVDRLDYTKGIVERLQAFEQLLIDQPQWLGRVRFVQVASPTRIRLKEYADYQKQVLSEVQRINDRFTTAEQTPVVLLNTQHDRTELEELYRGADVCIVSSLHDGMNLVSKEFVAARSDEQGVLVLSQFAGAAMELTSALIINPYHTVQVAAALHQALSMSIDEQKKRMRALRHQVKNANVYRWAANMLSDAAALRAPHRHLCDNGVVVDNSQQSTISMTTA